MVLTVVAIDSVSPRGGPSGTVVTVSGSGFGIIKGTITFDPLGSAIVVLAVDITTWLDDTIVFTVPVLPPAFLNRFTTVAFVKFDGSDFGTTPFWVPASPPSANGLDYQWPDLEEGTDDENEDDPRKIQAADYNRLADKVSAGGVPSTRSINTSAPLTGGGDLSADRTIGFPDQAPNRVLAGPTSGGLAQPTFRALVAADIPAGVAGVVTRPYAAGVAVNDFVRQRSDGVVDKADATSIATGPAIGCVVAVDTPSIGFATVRLNSDQSGFVGLTPGGNYLVSKAPGGIVREDDTLNPDYPGAAGNFQQVVGVAASATILLVTAAPGAVVEV
jgi:hypothetical protein